MVDYAHLAVPRMMAKKRNYRLQISEEMKINLYESNCNGDYTKATQEDGTCADINQVNKYETVSIQDLLDGKY